MPLTPDQEWILTSSAMIAMADRVLKGTEAGRVLAIVNEHVDAEDQDHWMDLLTDLEGLQKHFDTLPAPRVKDPEPLLEQVWSMALVDGEASMAEVRIFEKIAGTLNVHPPKANKWRRAWTATAVESGELQASMVAVVLGLDGDISEADRKHFEAMVDGLPISKVRARKLLQLIDRPPADDEITNRLALLPAARQQKILKEIAAQLAKTENATSGLTHLRRLASDASLDVSVLESAN